MKKFVLIIASCLLAVSVAGCDDGGFEIKGTWVYDSGCVHSSVDCVTDTYVIDDDSITRTYADYDGSTYTTTTTTMTATISSYDSSSNTVQINIISNDVTSGTGLMCLYYEKSGSTVSFRYSSSDSCATGLAGGESVYTK